MDHSKIVVFHIEFFFGWDLGRNQHFWKKKISLVRDFFYMDYCVILTASYCIPEEQEKQVFVKMYVT